MIMQELFTFLAIIGFMVYALNRCDLLYAYLLILTGGNPKDLRVAMGNLRQNTPRRHHEAARSGRGFKPIYAKEMRHPLHHDKRRNTLKT